MKAYVCHETNIRACQEYAWKRWGHRYECELMNNPHYKALLGFDGETFRHLTPVPRARIKTTPIHIYEDACNDSQIRQLDPGYKPLQVYLNRLDLEHAYVLPSSLSSCSRTQLPSPVSLSLPSPPQAIMKASIFVSTCAAVLLAPLEVIGATLPEDASPADISPRQEMTLFGGFAASCNSFTLNAQYPTLLYANCRTISGTWKTSHLSLNLCLVDPSKLGSKLCANATHERDM
ncbi:hypothetical protein CSOJ01_14469 [Colletotrichum sojae]|uniref:Uncharacterized protein n=1 Tax=Colletotrichum sojae TaxID=2175907 RepID=A0A8H6MK33_9PEZI|nr:hypothetical protein CSOJ01_14469 [Colletotrichum sojae]